MNPDKETAPPEPAAKTLPAPPPSEASMPVVRAGGARVALLLALADVGHALARLEALADGIARALDETTKPRT